MSHPGLIMLLVLAAFALAGLAMFALALRVGPKRGWWNQPAAAFTAPAGWIRVLLDLLALATLVAGGVIAVAVPGAGVGVVLVTFAMAAIYVLMAHASAPIAARRRAHLAHDRSE